MDHPHTLSDATLIPIAPELLESVLDPNLATQLNNQSAPNNASSDNNNNNNHLLDSTLGDKWDDFASATADFYPAGNYDTGNSSSIDATLHLAASELGGHEDIDTKLHLGPGGNGASIPGLDGRSLSPSTANQNQTTAEGETNTAEGTGGKRKRARRDGPSSTPARKRPSMVQDPNDPNAHLLLPSNLQGRAIEYATAPLEDTRHGPVFVHPPQGSIQACVRCHGIKRKCEALEWSLKMNGQGQAQEGQTTEGGVNWTKPRCSGCEKADVPCVFELAAASSGFVHHLRSENAALTNELATARQRIQELEISLAVSQTE